MLLVQSTAKGIKHFKKQTIMHNEQRDAGVKTRQDLDDMKSDVHFAAKNLILIFKPGSVIRLEKTLHRNFSFKEQVQMCDVILHCA